MCVSSAYCTLSDLDFFFFFGVFVLVFSTSFSLWKSAWREGPLCFNASLGESIRTSYCVMCANAEHTASPPLQCFPSSSCRHTHSYLCSHSLWLSPCIAHTSLFLFMFFFSRLLPWRLNVSAAVQQEGFKGIVLNLWRISGKTLQSLLLCVKSFFGQNLVEFLMSQWLVWVGLKPK